MAPLHGLDSGHAPLVGNYRMEGFTLPLHAAIATQYKGAMSQQVLPREMHARTEENNIVNAAFFLVLRSDFLCRAGQLSAGLANNDVV